MSAWDDEESGLAFNRHLRKIKNPNTVIPGTHGGEHVMLHGVAHKSCSKCGSLKPLDQFYANTKAPDGKRPDCIECAKKNKRR